MKFTGKKLSVVALVLLLSFSIASLFMEIPEAYASSLTFTSSSSDGYISLNGDNYNTVHDSATGNVYDSDVDWSVGQETVMGAYNIVRGFLFFDTSAIPESATIDSTVLSLYVKADYSATDFNVTVQSGQPTYPHDPLQTGDYYYNWYGTTQGGTRSTNEISGVGRWNITLNSAGLNWIQKNGVTKLCIRSHKDVFEEAPTTFDAVEFYSRESGESYAAKLYVTYSLPGDYFLLTFSSSPEINAQFSINGTEYNTPTYEGWEGEDTAHLTAEEAKIYDGEGYQFDRWVINGTDTYYDETIDLTITGNTTIVIYYSYIFNLYHFYGPYDEETGYLLDENVTVSIYYDTSGYPFYEHEFNGSWVYPTSPQAMYFMFTFSDNSTREYWVDPSEEVLPIYIFKGDVTEYTINFLDTSGILNTYPYVTIKRYVNGTLYTIEKRKADEYGSIIANLVDTKTYQIVLGNEETTYVFGDLIMTYQTSIQLVLRGVDFPKDTILLYKYVRIYGERDFDSDSILLYYNDTAEATDSVNIFIFYANGSNAYAGTIEADSFVFEWANAEDDRTYQVKVYIHHETYGTLKWNQLLVHGTIEPPFGLDFLGNWPFESDYLIPAIIILCVAACFSVLNAYVGAILTCITAIILTWMGWIPIPPGALVAATAFAVLMALIYNKRSVTVY